MITKLEENGRKKADRYWPEKRDVDVKLENGIVVRLLTDRPVRNKPGIRRRFIKITLNGRSLGIKGFIFSDFYENCRRNESVGPHSLRGVG